MKSTSLVPALSLAVATMAFGAQSFADEGDSWTDRITLSGVAEFEAFVLDAPGVNESDADLATIELGVDAEISDSVSAYILFLIEGPDHEVELDEGGIVLGLGGGVSLNLGRQYVPFGSYESHLISDPLTLEIGETNESAALIEFGAGPAAASFYIFNGDTDEFDSDTEIDNFGLNLAFSVAGFEAGIGYINSIADSDALGELFEEGISDYPAGLALHAIGNFAGFTVIGEYVTASDSFAVGAEEEVSVVEPSAFNFELGYGFEIAGREASVAIAFQGTEEALVLELPESKTVLGFSVGISEATSLSLEYAQETDYDVAEGGSGDDTDVFTLQIAAEF